MANGFDCKFHADHEKRLYKLESEDRLMNEKLLHITESLKRLENDFKKMKEEIKQINEKMAGLTVKIGIGGVILYTLINLLLKKVGA